MKIGFRPVTDSDLLLLANWIRQAHWQEWWGDPEIELGYIRDMLEGRDSTRPFIFQVDGKDTGYIQVWYVKDQLTPEWTKANPWLLLVPREAAGVDLSIGRSEDLARGIGSSVLRAFVAMLREEGCQRIIIDPDSGNHRAIRAYRKAGFREMPALVDRADGCLIMEHTNQEGVT